MNVPKRLVIVISVILLVACQTTTTTPKWHWEKDGVVSKQEGAQDNYQCLQEAQQQVTNTYIPPTAYEYTAATSSTSSVTNQLLYNSCMEARGWSKKYQENKPPS